MEVSLEEIALKALNTPSNNSRRHWGLSSKIAVVALAAMGTIASFGCLGSGLRMVAQDEPNVRKAGALYGAAALAEEYERLQRQELEHQNRMREAQAGRSQVNVNVSANTYPHTVRSADGTIHPAPGYKWANSTIGDFQVMPEPVKPAAPVQKNWAKSFVSHRYDGDKNQDGLVSVPEEASEGVASLFAGDRAYIILNAHVKRAMGSALVFELLNDRGDVYCGNSVMLSSDTFSVAPRVSVSVDNPAQVLPYRFLLKTPDGQKIFLSGGNLQIYALPK